MSSIPYLPFEIIEHVNSYLSHQDRYELLHLNKSFYHIFIILLYRTITVKSPDQLKQLLCIFNQTESTKLPLGKCVHQLNIFLDELSEYELATLQASCPYVQAIHVDWRIWNYLAFIEESPHSGLPRNYHARRLFPMAASRFLSNYGACKLSSITLDLYSMNQIDAKSLLCYTPNLRNLTLMGINQHHNITIQYVESIHTQCPHLESIALEGFRAEAEDFIRMIQPTHVNPLPRMKSFQLKCQYGADRYHDWLPYLGKKYPNLISLDFRHLGTGKDIIEPCPVELYRQFIRDCPHLTYIMWNNTAPDFRFFQELDKAQHKKLKRLEVYDNVTVPGLLTSALFESPHQILGNLTRLTFGPIPRGVLPNTLVQSIANACPRLVHLCLREPHCNLNIPFKIDSILDYCRKLTHLELHNIALRVSFDRRRQEPIWDNHPLESLVMRHCSSFDGVFDHISPRCPSLNELILFAFTQRDRRYKVQIHMPFQRFRKIQLHGLRTETFDLDRRIRFFSIGQQHQATWYYMSKFTLKDQEVPGRGFNYRGMEMALDLSQLKSAEVYLLRSFLEKPMSWSSLEVHKQEYLKWNNTSMVEDWQPKDIYDAGYVDLVCESVDQITINKKRIIL
ncbi:hypothetical protein MUCCIDRAFT_84177 [Mucor lusitanicus CBS 277.49]|uniref:F-box domain-containing protein n=2 Tax=Mucor circinelloides f. lusitanicus TaxID=29924 RepID=A0A168HVG1_MUCCL|nr:hypothetical protein MUCCIDRAFT_84177 [Mucor lusitanicus CBS 277.49]